MHIKQDKLKRIYNYAHFKYKYRTPKIKILKKLPERRQATYKETSNKLTPNPSMATMEGKRQ